MTLACPNCGNDLAVRLLTNGRYVCECLTEICPTVARTGKTSDEAADAFVRSCEEYGWTVDLENTLKEMTR